MSNPCDEDPDDNEPKVSFVVPGGNSFQVSLESVALLLLQAMGGSAVFNYEEAIPAYNQLKSGQINIEITEFQDPWRLQVRVVNREQGNL